MSLWIVKCEVFYTPYMGETERTEKLHLVRGDSEYAVSYKVDDKYADMCEPHGDRYIVNILDISVEF